MKRQQAFSVSALLLFALALTGGLSPMSPLLGEQPDTREETRSLTVAVAQVASTSDIAGNLARMRAYVEQARQQDADLVLFSECCLSGYAGLEITSTDEIGRKALARAEEELRRYAKEAGLFIAYGTTTFQPEGKPLIDEVIDLEGGVAGEIQDGDTTADEIQAKNTG